SGTNIANDNTTATPVTRNASTRQRRDSAPNNPKLEPAAANSTSPNSTVLPPGCSSASTPMKARPNSTNAAPPTVSRVIGARANQADMPMPDSNWQAGAITAPCASGAWAKPVIISRLNTGPDSAANTTPRCQPMPARSRQPQRQTKGSITSAPG